ncbi:MAG: hypothetical protein KDJ74_00710, partial [Notoacmeibacter sp.]|nr:hypothetical protein [Notoacmeibacter sp.]
AQVSLAASHPDRRQAAREEPAGITPGGLAWADAKGALTTPASCPFVPAAVFRVPAVLMK